MKIMTLLILTSLLLSCRSTESPVPTDEGIKGQQERIAAMMADLSPREGKLFFFTAVTREQYREKELESCRREAASQLSRYMAINGVNYVITESTTGAARHLEAGEIAYNADLAASLESELILEDSIMTSEGSCALFSYKSDTIPDYPYRPHPGETPPSWTHQALKLEGYQAAVGFTGPRRFLERTLQQADKNALATILEQRSGKLETTQKDWQSDRASLSTNRTTSRTAGTVRQAYIISRWQDEKGNLYSLALAPLTTSETTGLKDKQ